MDKVLNYIEKGLMLDVSPQSQPKGTYRYGLNLVDETDQGDINRISVEEADFLFTSLKENYTPIGKVYMTNKKFVIFSLHLENSISEIGILDIKAKTYTTVVNDSTSASTDKLNFSIRHQIQAVYRLKNGCENAIYWVDKNSPARYFNFDKQNDFKNEAGNWVVRKFNLQRTVKTIPSFSDISILEAGGNIPPGSYNIAVQMVDGDLNPTEWITTSPVVKIYNDLITKNYGEIEGAIVSSHDYLNFSNSNKAIQVSLSDVDVEYPYYRLAIIAANSGIGVINEVYITDVLPTAKPVFTFNGQNFLHKGSTQEIAAFQNLLGKVGHIEQIENRLLLGDVSEPDLDYCALQKYASQIQTDCVVKKVILNSIVDPANPKHPNCDFNGGAGYMPGEIYARGIVYIFDDNTLSPTYHIPGKPASDKDISYSPGNNVYPMSINNECKSTFYTDNNNSKDYWGIDYKGIPLKGKNVRHHRLPLRSEIGLPLVIDKFGTQFENKYYYLNFEIQGDLITPVPCPSDQPNCGTDKVPTCIFRVDYTVDGEADFFTQTIDPNTYSDNVNDTYNLSVTFNSKYYSSRNIEVTSIQIGDENGIYVKLEDADTSKNFRTSPKTRTYVTEEFNTIQDKVVEANIFGFRHTNIKKPLTEEIGKEVIGYYIVRAERTEFDKTIIDSAVLFPTVVNNKYISSGLLQPQTKELSRNTFSVIHPEHKFNNRKYTNFDRLIQEGNYRLADIKYGKVNFDDVYDGSSFDPKAHKEGNDDGHPADGDPTSRGFDGWSFNLISRDNIVAFENKKDFTILKHQIKEMFYLDALESKSINDYRNEVFNIASDNKIGIIQTTQDDLIKGNLPYVVMYKENTDPYANFRSLPYYKENSNPSYFQNNNDSTVNCFSGDTYITSMRYNNSIYWDNRVADRKGKKSILKIILGIVVAIAGAILAAGTFGAGSIVVGAGITLIGAGALFTSSGIKIANFNKAYAEEYDKGLRQTALDGWTDMFYNYKAHIPFGFKGNGRTGYSGPSDDTIQWAVDCVTDLWFESNVNMSLRNGFAEDQSPTFLNSPGRIESGNDSPIGTWEFFGNYYTDSNAQRYPVSTLERHATRKLLAYDDTRDDNRYYLGAALGEYYQVNPDYNRKNKEKAFFHLPIEYNCCSDCKEVFSNRWHWSEQSFQEELTDNYRTFLPNNYRDLDGETGAITNMFTFGSELFIHTEEALWQVPKNYQERITDQIVSFIGTGDFFSVPPRKVIDDSSGNSAGSLHKWGTLKSVSGIYFVSENQGKIYHFDGRTPKPISREGISNWFGENIPLKTDLKYYQDLQEEYPFKDNPSNPYGTGFTLAYDSKKERILVTKLDYIFEDTLVLGTKFTMKNNTLVAFKNYKTIISNQEKLGWTLDKENNGTLIFSRNAYKSYQYKTYQQGVEKVAIGTMLTKEFDYIQGEEIKNPKRLNNSWTLSYSLKRQSWLSWHSYFPRFYLDAANVLISNDGDSKLYKHNNKGIYNSFRGINYPSELELITFNNSLETTVIDSFSFNTTAERYNSETESFNEIKNISFTDVMFYNSEQHSGQLKLILPVEDEDFMLGRIENTELNEISLIKKEKDWYVNQLRNIREDYSKPMFSFNLKDKQHTYFTDKVLNSSVLNYNKDWFELESFRDKFLAVRLKFDNFENVKLSFNYSVADEKKSYR